MGQKPAGATPSAATAAGQPGVDGESMFSKILPGGAAEQAGKLTEGKNGHECQPPAGMFLQMVGEHLGGCTL